MISLIWVCGPPPSAYAKWPVVVPYIWSTVFAHRLHPFILTSFLMASTRSHLSQATSSTALRPIVDDGGQHLWQEALDRKLCQRMLYEMYVFRSTPPLCHLVVVARPNFSVGLRDFGLMIWFTCGRSGHEMYVFRSTPPLPLGGEPGHLPHLGFLFCHCM